MRGRFGAGFRLQAFEDFEAASDYIRVVGEVVGVLRRV